MHAAASPIVASVSLPATRYGARKSQYAAQPITFCRLASSASTRIRVHRYRSLAPRQLTQCAATEQAGTSSPFDSLAGEAASDTLQVFSPSKINLFLRVMRRRDDGYHDLASLFHVISLGDTMTFSARRNASEDVLSCNMAGVPTDSSNLVIKALDLFRCQTGSNVFMDVDLQKTIPHGAGLGGGSGNAATALWAANRMAGSPATNAELLQWSADIGSDVPIFFSQGAAYCTGRGELVENVQLPECGRDIDLLLVKPAVGLSTPAIFKALDLERRSTEDPCQLLDALMHRKISQCLAVNDLEQPAFDILPELRQLKDRLIKEGGNHSAVFMTGSGSTIVCAGASEAPSFLSQNSAFEDVFVRNAKMITRLGNDWYQP